MIGGLRDQIGRHLDLDARRLDGFDSTLGKTQLPDGGIAEQGDLLGLVGGKHLREFRCSILAVIAADLDAGPDKGRGCVNCARQIVGDDKHLCHDMHLLSRS